MVPIEPAQFNPLMQQAKDAGMIVGTVNTGDSTELQDFTLGTDYPAYGASVAENIGKIGGDQKLLIVTNGPGGVGDVIIESLKASLPDNVEIVDTAFDNADAAQTTDVVSRSLTAHPEITVIWSWEGTAVAGITTAIKEKGLTGQVFGVVNDLTDQAVAGLREGTIYGASKQNFCDMATQAIDLAVAKSKGEDVPAATDTGTTFVTIDNLDDVLAEN
jgi:ABC-type sugar transport system substrate-binding protein